MAPTAHHAHAHVTPPTVACLYLYLKNLRETQAVNTPAEQQEKHTHHEMQTSHKAHRHDYTQAGTLTRGHGLRRAGGCRTRTVERNGGTTGSPTDARTRTTPDTRGSLRALVSRFGADFRA